VNDQKHIIVLNGHRYNAKTGENLSHSGKTVHVPKASHQNPVHQPASAAPHKAAQGSVRQTAGHVKAHSPKPAKTLMRHAVKRPSTSLKRRIRVQAHLDSQIKQPEIVAPRRSHPVRPRVVKARKVHLIHHFSPSLFTTVTTVTTVEPSNQPLISTKPITNNDVTPRPTMQSAFAPKKPRTTAELLEYAIRYADSPLQPEEPVRRRKLVHRRAHAVAH